MLEPQKRINYQLVIDIDKYIDKQYPELENDVHDCTRISHVLRQHYGYEDIQSPLHNEEATRKNILEALASLRFSTSKDDNLIIYFAGHGIMNPPYQQGILGALRC